MGRKKITIFLLLFNTFYGIKRSFIQDIQDRRAYDRCLYREVKSRHSQKLVVAVPVAPPDTIEVIAKQIDECVVLSVPDHFLGAVGAYYEDFHEITDEDVLNILKSGVP